MNGEENTGSDDQDPAPLQHVEAERAGGGGQPAGTDPGDQREDESGDTERSQRGGGTPSGAGA